MVGLRCRFFHVATSESWPPSFIYPLTLLAVRHHCCVPIRLADAVEVRGAAGAAAPAGVERGSRRTPDARGRHDSPQCGAFARGLGGQRRSQLRAPKIEGERPHVGSTIETVEAVGKHLLIHFDDGLTLQDPT
jgi:hypothetical protein